MSEPTRIRDYAMMLSDGDFEARRGAKTCSKCTGVKHFDSVDFGERSDRLSDPFIDIFPMITQKLRMNQFQSRHGAGEVVG